MSITAGDIKELREQTGVGMMDCKKALTEADGDIKKALLKAPWDIDYLASSQLGFPWCNDDGAI